MKKLLKLFRTNILIICTFELLVLTASIMCSIFLPLLRNNRIALGIVSLMLFVISATMSFILSRKITERLVRNKEMDSSIFLFYFLTLFLIGTLITIVFLVVRCIDNKNFILTQGFATVLLLIVYYLLLGICFYVKKKD